VAVDKRLLIAAAAAVVVAAGGVAVAVHNSAPDVVVSTAGQTAEATAAAMRAAATPKADNWVVPASAVSVPAGVLAPGAFIALVGEDGGFGCTLGAGIRAGDRTGFVTAGHCGNGDGDMVRLDSVTGAPLGVITDADEGYDSVAKVALDYAAVWTDAPAPNAATVAGLPVAGVMTREAAATLKRGTPICFDGATSGVVCSPLKLAGITSLLTDSTAVGGDSGSPVFVVDGETGAATLLGIMSGSNADLTEVAYLDPALERLGAQALVDPTAAASVAGDPRYSNNISAHTELAGRVRCWTRLQALAVVDAVERLKVLRDTAFDEGLIQVGLQSRWTAEAIRNEKAKVRDDG
jgi:hypothetical protein